ncbi:hypothetical protein [uncultured Roseibium sp.]|uniref:hypothetical protein n=1 Tax=uncultured Roseibium sp. TaxID=1936171 RepID=UPI00261C90BD|nr:hypothetical protein [uncultured Roseibium sp.]
MLKNRHARRTLALFTQGRAIHRDPSRGRGLAPAVIAAEAGVSTDDVVRCCENRPISLDAAEKLAAWNELDLTKVIETDGKAGVLVSGGPVVELSPTARKPEDFASLFSVGFGQ